MYEGLANIPERQAPNSNGVSPFQSTTYLILTNQTLAEISLNANVLCCIHIREFTLPY